MGNRRSGICWGGGFLLWLTSTESSRGLLSCPAFGTRCDPTRRHKVSCHSNKCPITAHNPQPPTKSAQGAIRHGVSPQQVPNHRPRTPATHQIGTRCEPPRRVTATSAQSPHATPSHPPIRHKVRSATACHSNKCPITPRTPSHPPKRCPETTGRLAIRPRQRGAGRKPPLPPGSPGDRGFTRLSASNVRHPTRRSEMSARHRLPADGCQHLAAVIRRQAVAGKEHIRRRDLIRLGGAPHRGVRAETLDLLGRERCRGSGASTRVRAQRR